jgi:hypothetical protein
MFIFYIICIEVFDISKLIQGSLFENVLSYQQPVSDKQIINRDEVEQPLHVRS